MRNLKISSQNKSFDLPDVPEDLQFVANTAKMFAKSQEEFERFYSIGVQAAEELKLISLVPVTDKRLLWTVRQTIIIERDKENHS